MPTSARMSTDWLSVFKMTTRQRFDWLTPLAMLGLGVIGVAFIYSAQFSTPQGSMLGKFWVKQCIFLLLGAGVYVGVSLLDYRFWLSWGHWLYLACLVPLVVVFIPGVGGGASEKWGADRWINLGFFSYQPSETAKVSVLVIAASILARSRVGAVKSSLGVLAILALAAGLPILLILLQPDLKSAIVLPPMVFSMLYVSQLSTRFFVGALGAFVLLVGVVTWDIYSYVRFMEKNEYAYSSAEERDRYDAHSWLPLHGYQRNRIVAFIDPQKIDPNGIGWNQIQSLISVGSGGLTGKGWTKGTQAQLGYLPRSVAHNDFISSVIAEEKGFLGSLTVLSLFGAVMFNGIRIAGLARDRFGTLLAIGVTVLFAVHVFVNIAMSIGLVPITGIPLPLISYGGSFVLSCCFLQGLVQSVYRFRKDLS